MLLSSSIIINRLSGIYLYDLTGKIDDSMNLSRPVFLTSETTPQNRQILVGRFRKNEEIPRTTIHSMLITQGRLLESVRDKFDCILNFDEEVDLNQIVNLIHSIFNMYEDWYYDIERMAHSGAALSDLLDRSQVIFSNPLKIHDKDFKFIAKSTIIETSPNLSFLQEDQTEEMLNNFILDKSYRDTYNQTDADFFPANLTGYRTAYKNIFSQDKFLCRVLVIETIRMLQPSDLPLLDLLCEQVEYILTRGSSSENMPVHTLNSMLHDLLDGKKIDNFSFLKMMSSYGWTPEKRYFCIKIQIDRLAMQNYAASGLMDNLERLCKGSCALEYEGDIVLYLNPEASEKTYDELLDSLKEFIRDQNLRVGVSEVYTGFVDIFPLLYQQADIALKTGLRYYPYKWIHLFREINTYFLLECCVSKLPASMVACPEIVELRAYDKQHGTSYFMTLKTYLDNNMQPVATARALFVHRTTFLYRMEKMTEKFHLNLENPKKRLMYQLSILLLEQMAE